LEVCRLLGIYPNSILPAYYAYSILFSRRGDLDGLCRNVTGDCSVWPECPHANSGCYERVAQAPRVNLEEWKSRGEDLAGQGIWAMVKPRTKEAMNTAKREAAEHIRHKAERLYIRPQHLLCILCQRHCTEPLIEDNLIELRDRMEADPEIPVVVTEGCCMVCDPCPVYHPGEHICYHAHPKNVLRDLRMLAILGLEPGAEVPARELYRRIYDRIPSQTTICGWGDELSSAPFWAPCGGYKGDALERARSDRWLQPRA
jgi:hypothetical protein